MRPDDPNASIPGLSLSDLTGSRFVLVGPGRAPAMVKTYEAQLIAAGIHDIEYTDDFLQIMWEVANGGAYGLGVIEQDPPIAGVVRSFGLTSRLAEGLDVTSHTSLVWSAESAQQAPSFGKVLEALQPVAAT
jgi:hypothetical protein